MRSFSYIDHTNIYLRVANPTNKNLDQLHQRPTRAFLSRKKLELNKLWKITQSRGLLDNPRRRLVLDMAATCGP